MAGVNGQKSERSLQLPRRYRDDLLEGVDGRCRAARRWRDRLRSLVEECGGLEGLSAIELETLSRYVHHSLRLGKAERAELIGEGRHDEATMNDGVRSWLGLLRRVELIKVRRNGGGRDLARAIRDELAREEREEGAL